MRFPAFLKCGSRSQKWQERTMAILKHIASKSSNYGAALEYLIFKHDELRKTPILDQNGNRIMRDEFYLNGLNCEPYSFDAACQQLNREYQKNKNKNLRPIRQSFKRRSSLSGMPLPLLVRKQSRMKIFKASCRMNIIFLSKHNVVVIAICRRNGTSSYRSVLWEKAAKENVWKDSLFRTPRRICGTRKNPY